MNIRSIYSNVIRKTNHW